MRVVHTSSRWNIRSLVDTSDAFQDFSPYVPSISDSGTVCFQAAVKGGGTGIFYWREGQVGKVIDIHGLDGRFANFYSHPDINEQGLLTFYAVSKFGEEEAFLGQLDNTGALIRLHGRYRGIGPLGPTMNNGGQVAFRGTSREGKAGLFLGNGAQHQMVADTSTLFQGFQGLPVVNESGEVVFRGDLQSGGQGIFLWHDGELTAIADTHHQFDELGNFPICNDLGTVAWVGTHKTSGPGVFFSNNNELSMFADTSGGFESFRGVLLNNAGAVVFYATPAGGKLGIYDGPDASAHKVIAIGDPLMGSVVYEFALNPVSINSQGQIVLRVKWVNNLQAILLVEPNA